MRNMCLGITAFVVTVGMVSVGAQGRNFSGTWVVDAEKTAAASAAAMEQVAGGLVARGGRGAGTGTGGTISASGTGSGGGGAVIAAPAGGRARGTASGGGTAGAGGAVVSSGGGGAVMTARSGGGGGRGGAVGVATDMIITMDASAFTMDNGGFQTSYPINGAENTITLRSGATAKARASWKGDTLVIEQTIDSPNGPVTSTTSWFLEGDSLVRLTTRRTYFKKK